MTDVKGQVDLDEYTKLLSDLETEIREYGEQRKSLQEIVRTLQALDASNSKLLKRAEASIGTGELVYTQLNEFDVPGQIEKLRSRYDEHQRSLADVSNRMQQIVQEQQRASLEALQSSQHARESLERYGEAARVSADAHEHRIAALSDQMSTAANDLSGQLRSLTTSIESISTTVEKLRRQLHTVRIVAMVTLVALIAFALASFLM